MNSNIHVPFLGEERAATFLSLPDPIRHRHRQKRAFGFQTGDMVRATVPKGKYAGIHTGRVLVRATGSFDIATRAGRVQGISSRYCQALHRTDGYSYQKGEVA